MKLTLAQATKLAAELYQKTEDARATGADTIDINLDLAAAVALDDQARAQLDQAIADSE